LATEAGFDWSNGRILDPACGGGAFLAPVASRLRSTLSGSAHEILSAITDRLQGFELDPFAAWMSQVFLEAALLDLCIETGQRLPSMVKVGDTLAMTVDQNCLFDLVIGNPPYRKIRLSEEQRANYSRSLFGHANLYGLFTDAAIRWTRPGGQIAYVTPTSFLGGQYFKALRGLLAAEAPPLAMDFVTKRQGVFDDVLQETMLAVYGREGSSGPVRVHFLRPNGRNAPVQVQEVGAFPLPGTLEDPWLLPRDQEQAALFSNLLGKPWRLIDYGFGVSTGQLVWNRHKQQLRTKSGNNSLPLVWAESVTARGFAFSTERNNHVPYIQVASNQEHLVTRKECVLVQRTTAKEQERRLIAAVLPKSFLSKHGGAVIENHLNMIRPLQGQPQIPLKVLTAFLNSKTVDLIFRSISGSVAVSAYELNALPLPSPERFIELHDLIQQKASNVRIEAAIANFYQEEM
jgi:adenine-specific DNA-methyltransferase